MNVTGYNLDIIDRRLIAYLEGNARESTSNIARALGVARTTVHERMCRLERNGTICGYTVMLTRNPFENYAKCFLMFSIDRAMANEIVNTLKRYPEIKSCHVVTGEADLICTCEAPQLEDIDALVTELSGERGVRSVRSSVVMASRIDRGGPFAAGRPASSSSGISPAELG
ncbi:MAG: Lrp/AsnC family transcriptional regulator [Rhodobacteraceae bacterium]|nr:Lrp/AsnC family transcriptional regulator [Paracoccaceae bacterium]